MSMQALGNSGNVYSFLLRGGNIISTYAQAGTPFTPADLFAFTAQGSQVKIMEIKFSAYRNLVYGHYFYVQLQNPGNINELNQSFYVGNEQLDKVIFLGQSFTGNKMLIITAGDVRDSLIMNVVIAAPGQ